MKHKTLFFIISTLFFLCIANKAIAESKLITIYTYSSFASEKWGAGPKLKSAFEQLSPQCKIQYVPVSGSGALFNRIRLEGKKTKADMVIGLNNFMLDAAKKTKLFAKSHVNLNKISSPFKDQTFIPYGFAEYAFIYDKHKLKNPPKSLKELIDRQDLRVIYQDPRTSAVGQGFIAWMNNIYQPNEIQQAWKKLAKHTVTVGKGWSETYGAFLKGESDLVLSYNTSPLYHLLNENKDNYVATNFSEASIAQVEFSAILKGHESQCASDFMQYLVSPEAQKILSTYNVMLPIVDNISVPEYEALKQKTLNSQLLMPIIPQKQMKAWINTWQRTLSE